MKRQLPALKPRQVIRALERGDFFIHHASGSHYVLRHRRWQRKSRMSQLLTSDIGHPHVEKLVAVNTVLFRISGNRNEFWRAYAKAFPKPNRATNSSSISATDMLELHA